MAVTPDDVERALEQLEATVTVPINDLRELVKIAFGAYYFDHAVSRQTLANMAPVIREHLEDVERLNEAREHAEFPEPFASL